MNISTLESYVSRMNEWNRLFNKNRPALSLLNPADRQAIAARIDSDLSPENLSCDGELPPLRGQATPPLPDPLRPGTPEH